MIVGSHAEYRGGLVERGLHNWVEGRDSGRIRLIEPRDLEHVMNLA